MKKITIALFAIAATVSGCESIGLPGANDGATSQMELCLQANLEPCAPESSDDLRVE